MPPSAKQPEQLKDTAKSVNELRFTEEPYSQRELSTFTMESVGRLFVKLPKGGKQGKWPKLMVGSDKPPNMTYWWEMHEKYKGELR